MTMTQAPPVTGPASHAPPAAPTARHRVVALIVAGAATGFVVGQDGSLPWQLARVAAVVAVTVGLARVVAHGSRTQRRAVSFAAGCVSVAVGVGIGLPHLAKTGVQPLSSAGLCLLAAGLVLVAAGGVDLVRASRPWSRWLVIPGLLAALVVSVFTLGQAVAATNVPRTTVGSTTPGDLGLAYVDVEFETTDGITLSGWYLPSVNGAAVVLMHGAGSTRSGVLDHAAVLAAHGYGVLLFDARGHGRSEGRAMDFGWYGDEDVAGAVTFLEQQPGVDDDRLAAMGMSMGGEEALGAAAADPRIRAVVAEGATNRVAGDKAWLSDEFGIRGLIQEGIEWLTYVTADLLTSADPPTTLRAAVRAAAPRPVLLIAGGAVENERLAGRYIQSGSPGSVDLWIVPGAGHTAGLDTHPLAWEQHVTEFLETAL